MTEDNKFLISALTAKPPENSGRRDYTIKVWHLEVGKNIAKMSSNTKEIRALALTHDSKSIIVWDCDGQLTLWNLKNRKKGLSVKLRTKGDALIVTSDNKFVLTGSENGAIDVWNLQNGKKVSTYGETPLESIKSMRITKDNQYLFCAYPDSVRMFSTGFMNKHSLKDDVNLLTTSSSLKH